MVKAGPYAAIGAYGVAEAARFARVNTQTARRWIRGSGVHRYAPVLQPDLSPVDGRYALSFLDLIDLLVVGRFREEGVSLQWVRRAHTWLSQKLETRHPFAHNKLFTDGTSIFLEMWEKVSNAHESGTEARGHDVKEHRLIETVTGQHAVPMLLQPYLTQIEYSSDTRQALRWRIAEGVILDPFRSFGKPTLTETGTTTFVLASSYWANGENTTLVADLFNVSPESVRCAVLFESEFSSHRAA